MRVAFAQIKDQGDFEDNMENCLEFMELAGKLDTDILCFPEMQFSHFFLRSCDERCPFQRAEGIPGPVTELFQRKARELNMVVVLNFMEQFAHDFYSSSPVIDCDGRLLGVSRMVHVPQIEGYYAQSYFTPGCGDFRVYNTSRGKIGVLISYDRHFPEASRALALQNAELVLVPGHMQDKQDAAIYKAELQTLAYQNGYFAGLCNRVGREDQTVFVGKSLLVSPEGKIVVEGTSESQLVVGDINLEDVAVERCRNPYLKLRRPDEYYHIIRQA